jgi:hypothetical protein
MRSAGLFFEVIVIAVTPPAPVRGAMFTHRLSLVWSWTKEKENSDPQNKQSRARKLPYHVHEPKSYWSNALIMRNTKKSPAYWLLMKLATCYAMPLSEREKSAAMRHEFPSGIIEPTQLELFEIVRCFSGRHIIPFLKEMTHSISNTEEVLVALVQYHTGDVVSCILEGIGHNVNLTPKLFEAAAKNIKIAKKDKKSVSSDVLEALLDYSENHQDLITEAVLISFVGNPVDSNNHTLERLLHLSQRHSGELVTDAVLTAAARNSNATTSTSLKTLLKWSNDQPAAISTLLTAVDNLCVAERLMNVLWDPQYGVNATHATHATLAAALNHLACFDPDALFLLGCENPEQIETFLIQKFSGAAKNVRVLVQCYLLVRYQGRIPSSIWAAAARTRFAPRGLLQILLNNELYWKEQCYITEDILVAASTSTKVMHFLLLENQQQIRFPDGIATPNVLKGATTNCDRFGKLVMSYLCEREGQERVVKLVKQTIAAERANNPRYRNEGFSEFLRNHTMKACGDEMKVYHRKKIRKH